MRTLVRGSAAVSQLGGNRAGRARGDPARRCDTLAFASTIVDVTTEMMAQIAYIVLGVLLLSARAPANLCGGVADDGLRDRPVLAALAAGLFIVLQRYGHRFTGKLVARLLPGAVAPTAAVAARLDAIYRAPARVGLSAALHLAGWIASAVGAWIAFR